LEKQNAKASCKTAKGYLQICKTNTKHKYNNRYRCPRWDRTLLIMGKGMQPKKGYNQKAYENNYDSINWSSTRNKSKANDDNKIINETNVQNKNQNKN